MKNILLFLMLMVFSFGLTAHGGNASAYNGCEIEESDGPHQYSAVLSDDSGVGETYMKEQQWGMHAFDIQIVLIIGPGLESFPPNAYVIFMDVYQNDSDVAYARAVEYANLIATTIGGSVLSVASAELTPIE